MAIENSEVVRRLQEQLGDAVLEVSEFREMLSVRLQPEAILQAATFLRDDDQLQYIMLSNLCGVDYLGREPRFEVVYHFTSFLHQHRIVLKVGADEADPRVPSLALEFPTVTYQEREAYDMFGIQFDGHPDLQRILMPEEWDGFPQRKTEPLVYEEVAFTFNQAEIDAQKPFARE